MTIDALARACDVSRETRARLETHRALLERWNPRINLVSKASLADAWSRHFADSAQLWPHAPAGIGRWLDLGSGAGFPGLVIAAIAAEQAPTLQLVLVEADQRKAAFLNEVIRATGVNATVLARRIEDIGPQAADVISARALAPLPDLLAHAEKHLAEGGICLFPKGETVHKELADAASRWRFEHRLHPSQTDARAALVEIGAIERA
jgi:16S rRNA (guanine527-N7)-methyltransferase